jgi:hypothetical protein
MSRQAVSVLLLGYRRGLSLFRACRYRLSIWWWPVVVVVVLTRPLPKMALAVAVVVGLSPTSAARCYPFPAQRPFRLVLVAQATNQQFRFVAPLVLTAHWAALLHWVAGLAAAVKLALAIMCVKAGRVDRAVVAGLQVQPLRVGLQAVAGCNRVANAITGGDGRSSYPGGGGGARWAV